MKKMYTTINPKLEEKELIDSKMVNINEYESWDWDYKMAYDSTISSGRYKIYKVYNKNTKTELFFPIENDAINSVLKEAKVNGESNNVYLDKYIYTYYDSQTQKQYSTIFYNDEYEKAVSDIIFKLKNNYFN